jgi:flagellar protein FliO/FliZ
MRRTALVALLCGAPLAALAAELPATEPLGAGSVVQLTLSLAAVVAAIFGLGWVLRRMHGLPGSTHRALRIVATLPVGTRERLAVVQVGEAQILIGLSPGRIQTLHVLERPVGATPAAISPELPAASQGPATSPFKSLFDRERTKCDS